MAPDLKYHTTPSPEVLHFWRTASAVCFDVDSTVCTDEGIDELAAYCGAGQAVADWTTRAMGGSIPFEVALEARLTLMKPSASQLNTYLASHPPKISPGIKELVDALHGRGTDVYLVSGGFRQMIEPVAAILGIPKSRIYANRLLFAEDGSFSGFDDKEFTSRAGGKARAVMAIKKEKGYEVVVAVGDGATDLEARQQGGADAFIGYGGVITRAAVASKADWFVTSFNRLQKALDSNTIH